MTSERKKERKKEKLEEGCGVVEREKNEMDEEKKKDDIGNTASRA